MDGHFVSLRFFVRRAQKKTTIASLVGIRFDLRTFTDKTSGVIIKTTPTEMYTFFVHAFCWMTFLLYYSSLLLKVDWTWLLKW